MAKKKMDDADEASDVSLDVAVDVPAEFQVPQPPPEVRVLASFTARVYQLGQLAQSGNASEGELRELWGHLATLKPSDEA